LTSKTMSFLKSSRIASSTVRFQPDWGHGETMKPILSRREFRFKSEKEAMDFHWAWINELYRRFWGDKNVPYHKFKEGQTAYILYPRRSFAGLIVANMRRITVSRIVVEGGAGIYQTIEAHVSSGCFAQYCAQICFATVAEAVNETCKSFIPEDKRAAMIRDFEAHFAEIPINENAETTHTVVVEDLGA